MKIRKDVEVQHIAVFNPIYLESTEFEYQIIGVLELGVMVILVVL